ncbi:MAG: pseudouridine synthase [Planctomycetota bacterium]|nr:pseudouridine synthase [Planctomycetota bacterium]
MSRQADAPHGEGAAATERLHKFLASTGAGSRRECEKLIEDGRVYVNGKLVTKMGFKVDPTKDKVTLDGERVKPEEKVYWMLNKPSGTICTNSDERGRPRVVDLVPDRTHRIYTVGRLDAESRGLILLTNDGGIANIICHPRYRIEKVYQVAVRGRVDRKQVARIEAGVWLAEGKTSPAKVQPVGYNAKRNESLIEMTVFEGRNREVRRVLARVGLNVRRLQRTRIGPLELGELPPGASRRLKPDELTFVHEAEALYLANREAWDASIPVERPEPGARRPRGPRPQGKGKRPARPKGAGGGRPGGPRKDGPRPPRRGGDGGPGRPQGDGGGRRRRGGDEPQRRRRYYG